MTCVIRCGCPLYRRCSRRSHRSCRHCLVVVFVATSSSFPSPSSFPSLSSLLSSSPTPKSSHAADVVLLRCHHYRSIRAAATALPPLRCAPPRRRRQAATNVLLSRCRYRPRCTVALLPPLLTLLLPLCRRQAWPDVALSRCHHHCSLRAAATALLPSRSVPPPRFAYRHADVALLRCHHRR